jgi:hypothetical protein
MSHRPVVFEWLERIGLGDSVPSFEAKGITTPQVRARRGRGGADRLGAWARAGRGMGDAGGERMGWCGEWGVIRGGVWGGKGRKGRERCGTLRCGTLGVFWRVGRCAAGVQALMDMSVEDYDEGRWRAWGGRGEERLTAARREEGGGGVQWA